MDHGYRYTYEYDYPAGSGMDGVFGVIMSVYLIILTLVLIFALVSYIFHSIGLYTIGKRMGKEYPWLAFIPFFSLYIQGYIGDTLKYNCPPFNRYLYDLPLQYALPLLSIFSSVAYMVPLLGGLISLVLQLAVYVGQLLIYLFIFQYYEPEKKYLFTILSIIPVVGPLLVLYCTRRYRY